MSLLNPPYLGYFGFDFDFGLLIFLELRVLSVCDSALRRLFVLLTFFSFSVFFLSSSSSSLRGAIFDIVTNWQNVYVVCFFLYV